jgi:hypothetical protein
MAIEFSEEDEMLLQESYTALKIRNIISKVCNWQRIINDQPINPLQSSSQLHVSQNIFTFFQMLWL